MSDLITEAKIMLAQYDGRNRHPGLAQSEHDLARVLRKAVTAIARVEALHQRENSTDVFGDGQVRCRECKCYWPCPTVQALEVAEAKLQAVRDWPCPTVEAIGEG